MMSDEMLERKMLLVCMNGGTAGWKAWYAKSGGIGGGAKGGGGKKKLPPGYSYSPQQKADLQKTADSLNRLSPEKRAAKIAQFEKKGRDRAMSEKAQLSGAAKRFKEGKITKTVFNNITKGVKSDYLQTTKFNRSLKALKLLVKTG